MSGIRTQPPKVTASILPKKEPTMQESCDSADEFNKTILSYKEIAMKSVINKLSQVSQCLSECQMLIDPFNNIDEILPRCSDILSKMEQLVQSTAVKQHQFSESVLSCSSLSSPSSSSDSVELSVDDLFVSTMSSAIDKLSTKSIYNKRKAKKVRLKRLMENVPEDFVAIWQNSDKIFCQAPGQGPKKFNHQPRISVNWSKVNTRAFANLPTPQDVPLYGCSKHPIDYIGWHEKRTPFGSMPGFKTSLGIITCDTIKDPIHGFVYNKDMGGWVIHATREKDVQFNRRRQEKRKASGEKRWHTSRVKQRLMLL